MSLARGRGWWWRGLAKKTLAGGDRAAKVTVMETATAMDVTEPEPETIRTTAPALMATATDPRWRGD
jgi:hypothetical protein